ncbi:MAG TPA: hypothetical protein PLD27_00190 [bacterium]|nr:hypothetical protein [bacterium]HOL48109.1 hypothetical protein [bacterium]HPQ18102.1 hypothetical protein [bacterium]
MNCPKCGIYNSEGEIYCSNCNSFLNIDKLKSLFQDAKKYINQKDYFTAAVILMNCLKLCKNTEYEKQFELNLKLVKGKLKNQPEQIKTKIKEIIELEEQREIDKAIQNWKQILELNILPQSFNDKIIMRLQTLEKTEFPEVKKEEIKPEKKRKTKSISLFWIIKKYSISLIFIIGFIYIFYNLFYTPSKFYFIRKYFQKDNVDENTEKKKNVKLSNITQKQDLLFIRSLKGKNNFYVTKAKEKIELNEFMTFSELPITIITNEGTVEFKFNFDLIIFKVFENSNIEISEKDNILFFKLNNGKFYFNINSFSKKINVITNLCDILLTNNVYLFNILNDTNEIIVGNYPVTDSFIKFKKSDEKIMLAPKTLFKIVDEKRPEIFSNIENESFYKELIYWKYNLVK